MKESKLLGPKMGGVAAIEQEPQAVGEGEGTARQFQRMLFVT